MSGNGWKDVTNGAPLVILLAAIAAASGAVIGNFLGLDPIAKKFDDFGKLITAFFSLILVALFIERVIEVFTKGWRAPDREELEHALENAKAAALKVFEPTSPATKASEEAALLAQDDAVQDAIEPLRTYRANTRRIAFVGSAVLGLFAAMVGVRALELVFTAPGSTAKSTDWFTALDVVVTGLLIAGGADGLHKIVGTFTTWMDETQKALKTKKT
jgi:hypothetical protein